MLPKNPNFFTKNSNIEEKHVTDKNGNTFFCVQAGSLKHCSLLSNIGKK